MKQKSFVVTNFILIALLCTVFTNCDPRTNDSFLDTKHHEITSVKEAGYNFLHAYRTVLRNGLRGLTGATRRKITQECLANIYNIYTNDNELLMQCKSIYVMFRYRSYTIFSTRVYSKV